MNSDKIIPDFPLISIVVPVYKTEKFLSRCLDSLLAQTFKNIEIIVVDDASPGDVKSIINNYDDERILLLQNNINYGTYKTRLLGIKKAKGHYIAFVDSDDGVDKDFIKILYSHAKRYDADVVECGQMEITISGKRKNHRHAKYKFLQGNILSHYFRSHIYTSMTNKLYTSDVCKPLLDFKFSASLKYSEDALCNSIILSYCETYASVNKNLYLYFRNQNSATISAKNELKSFVCNIKQILVVHQKMDDFFKVQKHVTTRIIELSNFKHIMLVSLFNVACRSKKALSSKEMQDAILSCVDPKDRNYLCAILLLHYKRCLNCDTSTLGESYKKHCIAILASTQKLLAKIFRDLNIFLRRQ